MNISLPMLYPRYMTGNPDTLKPIIRDESGPPVFGVAPVEFLEKSLRTWTQEELAVYKEFVITVRELSLRRIESEAAEAGGHPVEPKGILSQTYWTPESGLVGVFDLRKVYEKALAASREPGFHPIRRLFAKLEYRTSMQIEFSHDVFRMLASARLVLLRRETGLPLDRLKKRADAILNEASSLFYKRTLLSTALPAIVLLFLKELVCHVIGRKSSAQPDKPSDTASERVTGLEETAEFTPPDLPHLGEGPKAVRGHFEIKIKDETGEKRCGVDATKILKRTLRLWNAQDRSPLTEIILVGNDLAAKQQENKLLQHGARPLYAMRPEGRTYALKREGAVQIINLARIFNTSRTNEPRTLLSFIRYPLVWFYYRTRLQSTFTTALPYGLAYAQLAQIERDTNLSRKAADELSSKLYWDLRFATWKRIRYWAMVPGWLIVFAMFWLRNRLRGTVTKDAKKPGI